MFKQIPETTKHVCQGCFETTKAEWELETPWMHHGIPFTYFCSECKESHEKRHETIHLMFPDSSFYMEKMEPMSLTEEDNNPFNHDFFHMGTRLGNNLMIMHPHHDSDTCEYFILVNRKTGERIKIYMQ